MPLEVASQIVTKHCGPAGEQEQAAIRDEVGVDDPRQVGLGEMKVVLDRRQGDVHDRRVEYHHQLCGGDDEQGEAEMTPDGAGVRAAPRGARGRGVRYTAHTPEVANGPRAAVVQLSPCVIPSWPLG